MLAQICSVNKTEATIRFFLTILASEIGIDIKELEKADNLAELGSDSLCSLTVLSRAREELGVDLPSELFLEQRTVAAVRDMIVSIIGPEVDRENEKVVRSDIHPPATSVLLQGNAACSTSLHVPGWIWLLDIIRHAPGYRLRSACLRHELPVPEKEAAGVCCSPPRPHRPVIVDEIRRRSAQGPSNLAGWSAGGIAAYDAATAPSRSGRDGRAVDSARALPNPIGLGKLPPHFYRFLEKAGVFGNTGGQSIPEWLLQHFLAFIDALDKYKPVPFRSQGRRVLMTTIIWALDGVCKNISDPRPVARPDDTKEMGWLLENRTNLGPNGWDQLVGEDNITIETVSGANHFSLVREPGATSLVSIVRNALRKPYAK